MFIEVPFLPSGRVTHVIVDKNSPDEFLNNLEKLKIIPVLSSEIPVENSTSTHPDMQLFHLGGDKIVCEPSVYNYYCEILKPLGFNIICGKSSLYSNYPQDIAYNIARVGNNIIHKISHTDTEILKYIKQSNISIIDVAQGYTKCAICIVSEKAVITSDHGLAKALETANIEVLTIEKGNIRLEGMNYGFIGGACGLIAPNLLAFCGNVEKHKDYKRIKAFAKKNLVDLISLCKGGLTDIGSIIPIKQEVIDWNSSQ